MSSARSTSTGAHRAYLLQVVLWLVVLVLSQLPLSSGALGATGLTAASLGVPGYKLSQDRVSGPRDGQRLRSEGSDGGDPYLPTIAPNPADLALAGSPAGTPSCVPAPATAPATAYDACGPPGRAQL